MSRRPGAAWLLRIGTIGTLAGLFSGLFGVGGGIVMVPLLVLLVGMDERQATSGSLGAIAVISAAAASAQVPYGTLRPLPAAMLGFPALVGVFHGTSLQQRLPLPVISALFGLLMIGVAGSMVLVQPSPDGHDATVDLGVAVAACALGYLAGVLSGLLGVGGGLVYVPALVYLFGLEHVAAEATSLLAILPNAVLGAARQYRYGNLDVRVSLTLGAVAIPGAFGGVALANALPVDVLRLAFAVLLMYAGQRLLRAGVRGSRTSADPDRPAPGEGR